MPSSVGKLLGVTTAVLFVVYISIFGMIVSDLSGIISHGKAQIDSLTKELSDTKKQAATVIVHIDTLWKTRTVYVKVADSAKAVADSVVHLVTDTTSACWVAYQARTTECSNLREALRVDSVSIRDTRDSLVVMHGRLESSLGRVQTLDAIIDSINAHRECRFLCPSRTTSFFLGAAATIFIGKVVF